MAEPLHGIMAAFDGDTAIVAAARALHERGYRRLDAFVPRPIPALEELLVLDRSKLSRPVFLAAVSGGLGALALQWFCNGWDYPLNVGGRPPLSLPAFIPIAFELTVLSGAVTAFVGVLYQMGLPRLYQPVFEVPGIERASDDQFWLYIAKADPAFDVDRVTSLLTDHGCVTWTWAPEEAAP
jgi:hypothetical protein